MGRPKRCQMKFYARNNRMCHCMPANIRGITEGIKPPPMLNADDRLKPPIQQGGHIANRPLGHTHIEGNMRDKNLLNIFQTENVQFRGNGIT